MSRYLAQLYVTVFPLVEPFCGLRATFNGTKCLNCKFRHSVKWMNLHGLQGSVWMLPCNYPFRQTNSPRKPPSPTGKCKGKTDLQEPYAKVQSRSSDRPLFQCSVG